MEFDTSPINRCSKEHEKIYQQWFSLADSDGDGRLTGGDAIKFFAMSNLPRQDLKQVWAISDSKRQGFLGFREFIIAMQLVCLAQAGHPVTSDLLNAEVNFENLQPPTLGCLDLLQAKKKRMPKSEPEQNGNPTVQSSLTANWFSSSTSVKKIGAVTLGTLFVPLTSVTSIVDGLKKLYIQKLKPLETAYRFNGFVSPLLTNSDFDAKPMVMLLGQY